MNCHRQEANGEPMDATSPAGNIKVGPYHNSVGFVSHPHANQFLNSPHAKFTGTFAQVPTGKVWSEYNSYFMTEGEAANTGNGCTGCHDVHTSVVAGEKPFVEECTECHAKDLSSMLHSGGGGTPLEDMATDPMEACVICHMPAGEHLFRINVDESYSTKPRRASAMTATVNANADGDGAIWVDLDSACGKCHGGGVANVETTGSIAANAATLTVATGQGANFTVGQRIEIAGAGAVYYEDGIGHPKNNEDFESYILSISGDVVTLAGKATKTVTNAAVAQNPVKNNAAYFTKADLAVKAAGIHNDKPFVSFGYNLTPGNTLQVNVDASASNCSGSIANCNAFIWEWDDTTTTTTYGPTATHNYAGPGTWAVKLTVVEYGVSEGSVTKNIKTVAVDGSSGHRRHGLRQHHQSQYLGGHLGRRDLGQRRSCYPRDWWPWHQAAGGEVGRRRRDVQRHRQHTDGGAVPLGNGLHPHLPQCCDRGDQAHGVRHPRSGHRPYLLWLDSQHLQHLWQRPPGRHGTGALRQRTGVQRHREDQTGRDDSPHGVHQPVGQLLGDRPQAGHLQRDGDQVRPDVHRLLQPTGRSKCIRTELRVDQLDDPRAAGGPGRLPSSSTI